MRIYVPYATSGRRPKPIRLGGLAACCSSCSSAGLGALPAWQTDPKALRALVMQVRHGGLGSLGLNQTEGKVVGAVASKGAAVGASALATYAGAGAIAGPIGAAVGVVIGLVAGLFMGKHYFDVAAMNADEDKEVQAWNQYTQIQGHVAGRALGLQTMASIWNGAVHSGLFPGNDAPKSGDLCFHNGCGKYPGDARWVTATIQGCPGHNCFPDALTQFKAQQAGKPANVPDAVYFIDSIFLPLFEQTARIKWISDAANGNTQVHQLLYDAADAYLAQYGSNTVPYVEYPQAQVSTETVAGAEGSPSGPVQAPPAPAAAAVQPAAVPYLSPAVASSAAAVPAAAGTPINVTGTTASGTPVVPADQTNALIQSMLAQGQTQQQAFQAAMESLQANGVNTSAPQVQQQVAGAVAAAAPASTSSLMSGSTGMILIALGLGGAILLGLKERKR